MHGTAGVGGGCCPVPATWPCWEPAASGRSHTGTQWVRLHRVCPGCVQAVGPQSCNAALPLGTSAPSSPLHAQQCQCLSPGSLITLCVHCWGHSHKSPLQRNLCKTSLRNSNSMSWPVGWRFPEISASQPSWLVIPKAILIKTMYINDHF